MRPALATRLADHIGGTVRVLLELLPSLSVTPSAGSGRSVGQPIQSGVAGEDRRCARSNFALEDNGRCDSRIPPGLAHARCGR
jgi:hypothetical protein